MGKILGFFGRKEENENGVVMSANTRVIDPEIGSRMEDGTVYAGISPDTKQPMYVTPEDAPLTMKWQQAVDYAVGLDAYGHKDWHVPTKDELKVLFRNHADIGSFNETGSNTAGWYWSSTPAFGYAICGRRFSDGLRSFGNKSLVLSLRCVRSEPRP